MTALLPARIPGLRPWTPSGRPRRPPRSDSAPDPQIGLDLTRISKVRQVFSGRAVLLAEVRTEEERRYCARRRRPFQHLAARYAAKEAVFRGLRTGLIGAMRWRDVEVVSGPCGEPQLILGGETARLASAKGVTRCAVFLTHAGDYSMAAVPFVA